MFLLNFLLMLGNNEYIQYNIIIEMIYIKWVLKGNYIV